MKKNEIELNNNINRLSLSYSFFYTRLAIKDLFEIFSISLDIVFLIFFAILVIFNQPIAVMVLSFLILIKTLIMIYFRQKIDETCDNFESTIDYQLKGEWKDVK